MGDAMHEASLMQSALELASERTRAAGGTRIHRIRLRVGELSGVMPEALSTAFAVLSRGGPAEGAELEIETVEIAYWCARCEVSFRGDELAPECPKCGEWSRRMERGRELELASMEIS